MKNILKTLTLAIAMILLASCNSTTAPTGEDSEYKKENDAYFEKLKDNPEYTKLYFLNEKTPIYYKVLKSSDDPNAVYPLQNSEVSVSISGKLINGQVFQPEGIINSYIFDPNKGSLIRGVQYALQSMQVGDKWEVIIPQQLGYGGYKRGELIPAFSTLIFTIELLEVLQL